MNTVLLIHGWELQKMQELDNIEKTLLERQLDEFIAAFKRPPDFLDGHHHVHQIPRVRRLVLELFQRRIGRNPV
mgnify:CR=1 FL=1